MTFISDVVTLIVQFASITIKEADNGSESNGSFIFSAKFNQPRSRDSVFELVLSDSTTATQVVDYVVDTQNITLPADLEGDEFESVFYVIIFGDDIYEQNEQIVFYIRPLSDKDSVEFPSGADSLDVTIVDNDGQSELPLLE